MALGRRPSAAVAALAAAVLGGGFGAAKAQLSSGNFDCSAGLVSAWSAGKKEWCCGDQGVGCSASDDTYNCHTGYYNREFDWPEAKKDWCCRKQGIGCQEHKSTAAPASDAEAWAIRCSKDCNGLDTCAKVCAGEQTQVHRCPAQDECPISTLCPAGSEPKDCSLSEWSAWSEELTCTGLCQRTRNISAPNRCGGKPCEGNLLDTKACQIPAGCIAEPQDCALDAWSEWGACGERVTCQKDRARVVFKRPENGGKNCEGELVETAACGDQCNAPADCQFSVWMEWSGCTKKCGGGEQTRLRTIVTRAENGGLPCRGAVSEMGPCSTTACEPAESSSCSLGDWSSWTECINGQQKMRRRVITTPVAGGGEACDRAMAETAPCGEVDDAPADCQLGDWSVWNLCDRTCDGGQTVRKRQVTTPAKNGGAACGGALEETTMCNTQPCSIAVHPCRVSAWSSWSGCSTSCGNGQESRGRAILAQAQMGGVACDFPLSEARGCDDGAGAAVAPRPECPIADCAWSDWSGWGACSKICGGGGQQTRAKSVAVQASVGGKPCEPTLTEQTMPCGEAPCTAPDCVSGTWAFWSDWGACAKTCNGGYRFRARSIAVEGNHCGKPAEGISKMAERCNNDVECVQDVDCAYSDWSGWSNCADQCSGTRARSRQIAVNATGSGRPCGSEEEGGVLAEIEACQGPGGASCKPQQQDDCAFGDWGLWTMCTLNCGGGQTYRTRQVMAPSGNIEAGSPGLFGRRLQYASAFPKELLAPAAAAQLDDNSDCHQDVENWEVSWSAAKKAWCCGSENIGCPPKPALQGGEVPISARLCQGPLNVTQPCNVGACNLGAVDCAYSDWTLWGPCTQCGGQRFRQRTVLMPPQNGGAECALEATEETEKCPRTCGPILYYCVWDSWTDWSGACSTTCGSGVNQRTRSMALTDQMPEDPVAIAAEQKDCGGQLTDLRACGGNPTCAETCAPEDCALGDWTEWTPPTCEGLCKRERKILALNNACGKPCEGTLNSTRVCPADCESKDCELTEWTAWTACASPNDQRYKTRAILQRPEFSGKGCNAVLNMTGSCTTGPNSPVDCEVSDWGEWTQCDKTCGGGQRLRSRQVTQEASNGGSACHESLQVTDPCNLMSCDEVKEKVVSWGCQLSAWSTWSDCGGSDDEQTYRTRFVMHPAQGEGKACAGEMKATTGCGRDSSKNCILSTWSEWSMCPVTCGGGQHSRSRSIESHAVGGGLQCEGALLEAEPCGRDSCADGLAGSSTACKVTDWEGWSRCSATCGEGYKERHRKIAQPALAGAEGCNSVLTEVRACEQVSCENVVDCVWGSWAHWTSCVPAPDICGVGYKRRARAIQTMPSGGGRLCAPMVADLIMPVPNCNGQPECCINGQWAAWTEWGGCSAACGRGTKRRTRQLARKETWCGDPAPGDDVDYEGCDGGTCEGDRDCEFGAWSAPSPCSADCHGSRVKTRTITKNGTGGGRGCDGELELSERCNPSSGQPEPFSCEQLGPAADEKQDCVMQDWSDWESCSATCERGSQRRARAVQAHALHGGGDCEPSLKEVRTCHAGVACFTDRVNCKWGEWQAWGECNSFDLRSRSRTMLLFPAGGGLACDGDVREVSHCGRNTTAKEECGTETYMCQWDPWTQWSDCSTTCGAGGERKRHRKLEVSEHTALEALAGPGPPVPGASYGTMKKFGEEKALPELEAQLRDVQAQRLKETTVAFALGCGTFAALLFALRGARRRRSSGRAAVASEYDVVPQQA